MESTLLVAYLGVGAWMDGRKKQLNFTYLYTGIVLAAGLLITEWMGRNGRLPASEWILSALPGLLFLLLALLSREKIGYGDGVMLLILGACLGWREIWKLWMMANLLLLFASIFLLATKKAGRNTRIPFVPFLWIAYLLLLGTNYG